MKTSLIRVLSVMIAGCASMTLGGCLADEVTPDMAGIEVIFARGDCRVPVYNDYTAGSHGVAFMSEMPGTATLVVTGPAPSTRRVLHLEDRGRDSIGASRDVSLKRGTYTFTCRAGRVESAADLTVR